ncbi:hypothetical protein TNIN_251501 [Trichonephila inaurata madagascariensis]|uniref:Uncharacterized protein n=1 Tax=Trichonephila inaurata madagascariensis TaxID=2747483 RepID=A0A8X7CDA0_9ARAC|nr:hypothetical protein TNIN_251501 [Trichonephila inaurata madagascariensis]
MNSVFGNIYVSPQRIQEKWEEVASESTMDKTFTLLLDAIHQDQSLVPNGNPSVHHWAPSMASDLQRPICPPGHAATDNPHFLPNDFPIGTLTPTCSSRILNPGVTRTALVISQLPMMY